MWLNSKRFKTSFVELFLGVIELVMSLPFFENYTGSLLHTASCFTFSKPIYLSSLIKTSSLTCGNRLSLSSKAIGRQCFAMASPTEWNRLPQLVRSQHTITGFRSHLKTHLFRLAYPPPLYICPVGANLDLDLIRPWTFPF